MIRDKLIQIAAAITIIAGLNLGIALAAMTVFSHSALSSNNTMLLVDGDQDGGQIDPNGLPTWAG